MKTWHVQRGSVDILCRSVSSCRRRVAALLGHLSPPNGWLHAPGSKATSCLMPDEASQLPIPAVFVIAESLALTD